MKIRSRGLGRRELQMNLREFKLTKEGNEVILSGVTHAPVTWETNIRFTSQDIGGMLKVAINPKVLKLALRWALRRPDPPQDAPVISWERKTGHSGLSGGSKLAKPVGSEKVGMDELSGFSDDSTQAIS